MISAPHDGEEIMKPATGLEEPITLFKGSDASTLLFVKNASWSWFPRRALTNNRSKPLYSNGWTSCNLVTILMQKERSITDAAMAALVSNHSKDPVFLFNKVGHLDIKPIITTLTDIPSGVDNLNAEQKFCFSLKIQSALEAVVRHCFTFLSIVCTSQRLLHFVWNSAILNTSHLNM